jgi:hypothetical protein
VFLANSYKSLPAWVVNLCLEGTGLQLDRPLDPGTVVLIEMDGSATGLAVEVSARVVHATPQPDGTWINGFAFSRPLSADEMDAML